MREILFKGKTTIGIWVFGDVVHNTYNSNGKFISVGIQLGKNIPIEVIPETVCQFTGLLDKNGKKIFENDLVEVYNEDYKLDDTYYVGYCSEHDYPAFDLIPKIDCESNAISYYLAIGKIVVIGNTNDKDDI